MTRIIPIGLVCFHLSQAQPVLEQSLKNRNQSFRDPRDTFIKTPKDPAGITIPLKSKSSQH